MKIAIHNFGPVHHYEFDLDKDFHLIVGQNSVGKSYAITIVYLILKTFLSVDKRYFYSPVFLDWTQDDEMLQGEIDKLTLSSSREHTDTPANKALKLSVERLLKRIFLSRLQTSVDGTFDTESVLVNQHDNDDFRIEIKTKLCQITLSLTNKRLSIESVSLTTSYIVRTVKTNRQPLESKNKRIIYHNINAQDHLYNQLYGETVRVLVKVADEVFRRCASIHYLPASRSGLYQALSAFGQIIAELAKSRSFLTRRIDLPNISEPLSDYFLKLSSITVHTRRFSESELHEAASRIESQILGGKVEFDPKTKRIMFKPNDTSLRLDLSVTSSMVSELSPIVSYLRYILTEPTRRTSGAKRRESTTQSMLIIEEPEAHLHPKVQIRLVKEFAALTKLGVKVVLTSHSNFVFNKTSNLIISGDLAASRVAATHFQWTESGSSGKALDINEFGIDDENFLQATEELFEEKARSLAENV